MKNKFEEFLELHRKTAPLLIGTVWNVQSAKVLEQQKLKAIGTSSAAVAESLGYADGQEMGIEEYLFIIRRIAASVSLPFTVDLEAGYGATPAEIAKVIDRLYETGVSGINIEDSIVTDGKRSILRAEDFAEKLRQLIKLLDAAKTRMFINVRCDSFLLGLPHAVEDAVARIKLYQDTGVHGLFFPCITKITDIERITEESKLPINVMCMPDLPDFKQLQEAGVKRISMGPFLNHHIYQGMGTMAEKIMAEGSFASLFR